ncbi:multicopper oxidase family protein [Spongiactinospora sp. TRM90649]|uniref:multicopper oxidase family protein n=1 Tax=Spongiactinospora sp. TRM90649 TaxID=3031114 RepID=UPI0023F66C29|nr:multicopper oxidase family protein [Spongiactinospora sp. TRM90649]MDF5755916.1 multicopper oxidase family protein [Spongiactinospora sp. TRM90649]
MSTGSLLALDHLALALAALLWPAAATFTVSAARATGAETRGHARAAAGLLIGALLATALRGALIAALAGSGWWFVAEKATLALPLVAGPALFAAVLTLPRLIGPALGREAGPRRPAPLPVVAAAYGAPAGVVVALTMSYPVEPLAATVIAALVAAATGLTWRTLTVPARTPRRWSVAGGVAVLCFALVWGAGAAWSSRVPAGFNLGSHHPRTAQTAPAVPAPRTVPETVPITDLRGPSGKADRRFTLTAAETRIGLPSGRRVAAWAFNGRSPGPLLRVRQGDLVEVRLRNRVPGIGVTLHWHGYPVPAGEDGVAGVTQDAVPYGGEFVYRFRAGQAGTYWYHSHDLSDPAVRMGLFGALVVTPRDARPAAGDHTVMLHTYGGALTVAVDEQPPVDGQARLTAAAGTPVRLRVVATDNVPRVIGVGGGVPYRLAAVDGRDLNEPGELRDQRLPLAAGGRYDVTFTMPRTPVSISVDGRADAGLIVTPGPGSGPDPAPARGPLLDITAYGRPGPDGPPSRFDRELTWVLDRGLAMLDGVPAYAHTVNGRVWPDIDAPLVDEGELLRITVVNRSRDTHPMHPHGHQVLVLSRNGVPATGSPLWMDTFDVAPGEVWVVALRADNPGIWMSHCHDLGHAKLGMTFHFGYRGVTTPFDAGHASGNHPE